jgi:hypothetical protein
MQICILSGNPDTSLTINFEEKMKNGDETKKCYFLKMTTQQLGRKRYMYIHVYINRATLPLLHGNVPVWEQTGRGIESGPG